jgi:hypothetical protein
MDKARGDASKEEQMRNVMRSPYGWVGIAMILWGFVRIILQIKGIFASDVLSLIFTLCFVILGLLLIRMVVRGPGKG